MKLKLIVLFFIFTGISFTAHAELDAPLDHSCEFYLTLEKEIPCGPAGYAKDFGYKYCEKFLKSKFHRFSQRGKDFIQKNAYCLQDVIYQAHAGNRELSCKEISSIAFLSHASCYVESGFCDLSLSDKIILTNIIKNELPLKVTRSQIKKVLGECQEFNSLLF